MQKDLLALNDASYQEACSSLCLSDPVLAAINKQYGPPPFWKRSPGFESLLMIILEQQVSLDSAKAHYLKLKSRVPNLEPGLLAAMSDAAFFECQVSRQKASYLRHLSQAFIEGRLDLKRLASLSDEEVINHLCQLKGIGRWTSQVYLMFCLSRPNCFPEGDIAAINATRQLYPQTSAYSLPEMYQFATRWSPHQTVASFYLWWWYLRSKNRKIPEYTVAE
jgi:DNA-3-methyladenine glycosylase II